MDELFDSQRYRRASIGIFVGLLCAPLVGSFAGIGSNVARIELRLPAELPGLPDSTDGLRALPRDVDAYLDDRFGFRAQLVTLHSLLHLAVGVSGSSRYVVGRDGWFFHREINDVLDQVRGTDVYQRDELDRWIQTTRHRKAWLVRKRIDFLLVIVPSKHSIYPEFLPEWVNVVGPTRYEQLRARLKGLPWVLDLHGPMLAAKRKSEDLLYFKTDSHWNDLGAFVAYQEIARWIRERHPGFPILGREDFSLSWEVRGDRGNHARSKHPRARAGAGSHAESARGLARRLDGGAGLRPAV